MSTRTSLRPSIVMNAASMASNITSTPTIAQTLSKISYTVSWSGSSPTGTLAVQACNDAQLNSTGGVISGTGSWVSLPLQQQPAGTLGQTISISGNSGSGAIDICDADFQFFQLIYTASGGTGTMTATVKGIVT